MLNHGGRELLFQLEDPCARARPGLWRSCARLHASCRCIYSWCRMCGLQCPCTWRRSFGHPLPRYPPPPPQQTKILIFDPQGVAPVQDIFPVLIEDDDPPPLLTINGRSQISEGSLSGLVLDFDLSETSGQAVRFALNLSSDQGNGRLDFEPFARSLVIPAGQRRATLVLKPRGDLLFEDDEVFALEIFQGQDFVAGCGE